MTHDVASTPDNGALMIILVAALVLWPLMKRLVKRFFAAFHRGKLFQVHADTKYDRRRQIVEKSNGKISRRRLLRTAPKSQAVVLEFKGDIMASSAGDFGRLVDEVTSNPGKISKVVVLIESPGGSVAHYGLMYSHMERLRNSGVELVSCIDVVGASGGYMMAAPSSRIVASSQAILGSIGVVYHLINREGLLKKLGLRSITITKGERKRVVTSDDPVDDEQIQFVEGKMGEVHEFFISLVQKYRKADRSVCNGDTWSALQCFESQNGLVDEIMTSAEYLARLNREGDIVFMSIKDKSMSATIQNLLGSVSISVVDRVWTLLGHTHMTF